MCIIVAVPANVKMPSAETLKECFNANPHGAGFMWADGKRVNIKKGFMTWTEFERALDAEKIPEDSAVVMHFRIATHGRVQPSCCHPFPVSSEPEDLRATSMSARFGAAHNGIINGRTTNDAWSDSMDFICDVVAPLARLCPGFIHDSNAQELLEGACQSKMALMDGAGDIALVGEFLEDGGVFYSNPSYIPKKRNWSSYGSIFERDPYGVYEEAWDDEERLLEYLPWDACQLCAMAHECAQWEPECRSDAVAIEACSYYSGIEEEEIAETFGL